MNKLLIIILSVLLFACKKESDDPITTPLEMIAGNTYRIDFSNGDFYSLKFLTNGLCEISAGQKPEFETGGVLNYSTLFSLTGTLENFTITIAINPSSDPYVFENCKILYNGNIISDYKDVSTPDYTFQKIN